MILRIGILFRLNLSQSVFERYGAVNEICNIYYVF